MQHNYYLIDLIENNSKIRGVREPIWIDFDQIQDSIQLNLI